MIQRRSLALALAYGALCLPGVAHAATPSVNECLAASESANKLDAEHKLRAERQQLLICAADSCPEVIREECRKSMEQLNQAIPSIVFQVQDAAGAEVSSVKVTMDGELLADQLAGTALPVDPGEHTFAFEVEGVAPISRPLVVRAAEQNTPVSVVFAELNKPPALAPAFAQPPVATTSPAAQSHGLSNQRIGALVSGGVGIVGVVVGSVFGLQASSKKSDAQSVCPDNPCQTQQGVDAWHKAKNAGTVSTIAFIVGGVGLAGGAALWFTDQSSKSSRPQVGFGIGSIQVRSSW